MSDNEDKGLIETSKKLAEKFIKSKKILASIGVLLPILQVIMIVIVVVSITLLPVMFFNNIKDGFFKGVDKLFNFFETGQWMSTQNRYYQTLGEEYEKYQRYPRREGEFDIPILVATSHYVNMFGPNDFNYANDDDENHNKEYNLDDLEYAIKEDTSRSFYYVANNELGTSSTLMPKDKKLIGHLVDVKLKTECINIADLIFGEDEDSEQTAREILIEAWTSFMLITWDTVDGMSETAKRYAITPGNAVRFVRLIHSYAAQDVNYLKAELTEILHTADENAISEFIRIIGQSDLAPCEGLLNIPIPTIIRFINYESYKKYLKEIYLPKFYINCKSCPSKNKPDDVKNAILDRMIDEIFIQKKAWDQLVENQGVYDDTTAIYIPGMSSAPVPIAPGGSYNISSLFGMRIHPITGQRKMHYGIDLAYPTGTPLYSIADGEVIYAGCQSNGCSNGWGKYVKIKHDIDGDGVADYYSLYAHMSVINVTVGTMVGGGQKIGEVGSTGASTGPHLHLEIHDKNGTPIDPLPILKGVLEGNSVFDNTPITTYYNQGDFKHVNYCNGMTGTDGVQDTISDAGCLPTAYAMVAVKLGYKINPVAVANYICQNTNYRVNGAGTSSAFFTDSTVTSHFNIIATSITNRTIDNVVSILKSGKPIIVSVRNGHFNPTGLGHFIVIDSIDANNNIKVLDPGNKSKTTRTYTIEEINTYVINHVNSGMWSFVKG